MDRADSCLLGNLKARDGGNVKRTLAVTIFKETRVFKLSGLIKLKLSTKRGVGRCVVILKDFNGRCFSLLRLI